MHESSENELFISAMTLGKEACFMACIFSVEAFIKHTAAGVLQSFLKLLTVKDLYPF